MDDNKVKDYLEKIEKHSNQERMTEETIKNKRHNIEKETETIVQLEKYHKNKEFVLKMYKNVPIEKVQGMSDEEYSAFTKPLNSSIVSGEALPYLFRESQQSGRFSEQHYNTATSLNTISSADSWSVCAISTASPDWFPDREKITQEYKIKDEVDKHIEYIGNQLQKNFPAIKDDFDVFIKKFRAFPLNASQYLDLIGARSLFFLKLIFDFSKQSYSLEYPRLDAIKKFVFGSSQPLPSDEPLLEACCDLYKEMSKQDGSGMSVKMGVATDVYVESLFRRLIGNIAAILMLREKYFKP